MKNLLYLLLVAVMLLPSCADEELGPTLTFDIAGKGAYVKLLNESARLLDLANLSTASYDYTVEFVDIDMGRTVSQFDIDVRFADNNPANGDNTAGVQTLKTITSFNTSPRGFAGADVSVTLTELLSLFGLSADQLRANDQFVFETKITTQDGAVFGAANSTAAVNGAAFGGHFAFTLTATCPLPESLFVGNYALTYEDPGNQAFGVEPLGAPGTVSLGIVGPTVRSFDFTYLEAGGFGQPPSAYPLVFICDQVQTGDIDTGLGCGAGSIGITASGTVFPQDITDDSVIRVGGTEWIPDGGCGVGAADLIIVLTKQ